MRLDAHQDGQWLDIDMDVPTWKGGHPFPGAPSEPALRLMPAPATTSVFVTLSVN